MTIPGRYEELASEIEAELERAKARHGAVPRAADYAPLVGKFVRMWRAATPEEHTLAGTPEVGMEDLIVCVADRPNGTVDVHGETRAIWTITATDRHLWQFIIWPSEDARKTTPGIGPHAL